MFRKSLFRLFTMIAVFALVAVQVGPTRAARMDLGGHGDDNFWIVDTKYCKDGFSLTITHTHLGTPTDYQANVLHETQEAFWLELASSSIPFKVPADATLDTPSILYPEVDPAAIPPFVRLAHGDGSVSINNQQPFTRNFFYTQLQTVTTPISITIERWDHGQPTANEKALDVDLDSAYPDDNASDADDNIDDITDESWNPDLPGPTPGTTLQDDVYFDDQAVEACLIDSIAPSITITSPLAQNYLQTATVATTWDATDDSSGSGLASSSGMLDSASVTNGQAVDLSTFLPGPHTLTVNAADHSGNPAQASVTFNVVVTIDSLIAALQSACSHGWISKKGSCNSLLAKLSAAKAAYGRGQSQAMRGALKAFLNELKAQKGKSVNQAAYDLLSADAQFLLH